ncbi:hypothetical protein [Aquimarina algiphila]|uniref:hypothetical protein n=1 Tax=Aquimarina algiphila TaxID=2047982 RepID=UPI0024914A79|nr:hypothetical protein [Aquimarina algiphila]
MTHKVILDNFSLDWLSRSIDEELGLLIFNAKCSRSLETPDKELDYILENFINLRWVNVFESTELSEKYKYQTYITIATILNKYGYKNDALYGKAIEGLKMFKDDKFGLLPSHQYKKAEKAIELLSSEVKYHTKKPTYKKTITQFRVGDVLSIKIGNVYTVVVVKKIDRINETPILEVYNAKFDKKPSLDDLKNVGLVDGQYFVSKLNYLPDMAHQIELIDTISTNYEFKGYPVGNVFDFIKRLVAINELTIANMVYK